MAKRRKNESSAAFARRLKRNKTQKCQCYGWHFPHRRGSKAGIYTFMVTGTPGCLWNPDGAEREIDWCEYEANSEIFHT